MTLFYRLLGFSSMFLSVFDVLASPRQDYLAGLQMLHKKALGCCYFPVAAPHPFAASIFGRLMFAARSTV